MKNSMLMERTDEKVVVSNSTSKSIWRKIIPRWQLYVLLLLPLLYLLLFSYYPMTGIQLAFKKFDASLGIWGSRWIGFAHFNKFFTSYYFGRVLKNTLTLSIYGLVASFPISVIFALMLNSMVQLKYKKVVQTVTYIPYFISTVVIVGMLIQVMNPRIGVFGMVYQGLFHTNAPDLLATPEAFPHLYVWSGIWQNVGWNSIIYLAALSSVDSELHEAAQIDGANRFMRVIHIDFPAVIPTMIMLLILNAGSIMNIGFEKTYLMQNNLNLAASEVISTYAYKMAFNGVNSDFGFSTAIGLFNSLINFVLIVTVNQISKKVTKNSLW